jgi:hypothetical protein
MNRFGDRRTKNLSREWVMTTEKKWNLPYAIEALTVHRDSRGALYEALRFSSQAIPLGGHGSKIFLFKTRLK